MRGFLKLHTFRIGAPSYWRGAGTVTPRPSVSYQIDDILMLRSDTLKHITLDFSGHGIDDELVLQDLSDMKVLETLYIDSGLLDRRREQGRLPARRICQMLPGSLKEFGLMGRACPLVHGEVLESINISARQFPLLKKVVVEQFGIGWQVDGDEWRRKFTSACEAWNIQLSWAVPRSSHWLTSSEPYQG